MTSAFASYHNQMIYTSRVSAFLFCLRKETPAKKRQTRGFTPRPRQRRAVVHSSWLSVGSSAHSPANAPELERMRARASCFASRSLARLRWLIEHCGAAMGSLIIKISRSLLLLCYNSSDKQIIIYTKDITVGTEIVYEHLLGTIRTFQFIPALPTASKSR